MIRLVALALLALLGLVVGGVALARSLLSWRAERRRRKVMQDAQREADCRESAARRFSRERAMAEVEAAERAQKRADELRREADIRVASFPPPRGRPYYMTPETLGLLRAMPQAPDDDESEECGPPVAIKAGDLVEIRPDGALVPASQDGYGIVGECVSDPAYDPQSLTVSTTWNAPSGLGPIRIQRASGVPGDAFYVVGSQGSAVRVNDATAHPLGWPVVGLPGGVLCAGKDLLPCSLTVSKVAVDRYDPANVAWVRVLDSEPLHGQAVKALGL